MGMKFLVLGLFLCLVLASFTEVSCQYEAVGDEGNSGLSMLDLTEHEYQADVSGRKQPNLEDNIEKEDQSAKKQSETQSTGQKNTTVSDNKTISLSILDESEGSVSDTYDQPLETKSTQFEATGDEAAKGSSMLDQFELEYQAHINGLKQAGSDEVKKDKDLEEQALKKSMLDDIELEYQATINGLKKPTADESNKINNNEEPSATRQSMLEEIEREYETIKQQKINDFTIGKDDDEPSSKRQSMLDEIEREYEAAAAGLKQLKVDISESKDDEEHSAKRQSMLEEIEREYEAAAKGLEQLKTDLSSGKDGKETSGTRKSMLEEIEREYEAAASGIEKLKADFSESKGDEEQSAKRQSMLEEIEREYEAAANSLKQLRADFSEDKSDEEQSAKRRSMLDEIEREYEAAASGLQQLKVEFTESKDDSEQSTKRQSMLDEIEREYEAASKNLQQLRADFTEGKDDAELSAKRQSMLEEMEREYEEAAKNLKHLRVDFTESKDDKEQSAKRQSMLDEIEREYEAAANNLKHLRADLTESKDDEELSANRRILLDEIEREYEAAVKGDSSKDKGEKEQSAKKQSGSSTLDLIELAHSADVCGCFNQHTLGGGLKEDKEASIVIPRTMNIDELLQEDIPIKSSETSAKTTSSKSSSLTTSLTQLVENHKNPKVVFSGKSSSFESSSSGQSEPLRKSERSESLKMKIKGLRGVSVHDLLMRSEFDEILEAAASLENLDSVSISYISRLAKYKTVIKEGIEASNRVHRAQSHAKMLKEIALENQAAVDADIAAAKALAQRGDALYVKIVALRKLLAKLEAEKESVDVKFHEVMAHLSRLLEEASHAQEEYQAAFRRAKEEEAAQEFAREAAESAERIWNMFLSSL